MQLSEARRVERHVELRIDVTNGQANTRRQFDENGGTREWDLARVLELARDIFNSLSSSLVLLLSYSFSFFLSHSISNCCYYRIVEHRRLLEKARNWC